jgi:hypothetical protein
MQLLEFSDEHFELGLQQQIADAFQPLPDTFGHHVIGYEWTDPTTKRTANG